MTFFGKAAIGWTDSTETGTERVHLLQAPLREIRPAYAQTVYMAESLDRSVIESLQVGTGYHEFSGTVRYDTDPQSLLDLLKAGNQNQTLTYWPNLADSNVSFACKLISPRGNDLEIGLDAQRATFNDGSVQLRLRATATATPALAIAQKTNALFWYRAGDSLEAATFVRADTAHYATKGDGTLTSAASGKARLHWMDLDSDYARESPVLLLERGTTNLISSSENFGAWSTSGTPVLTSGQVDPKGGTAGYLIEDDSAASAEYVYFTPTFTGTAVSVSLFIKQGTATVPTLALHDATSGTQIAYIDITWGSDGVPVPAFTHGTTGTIIPPTRWKNGYWRVGFGATLTNVAHTNQVQFFPAGETSAGSTGTTYAYGGQAEDTPLPTSYNPTSGSTDARAAESLNWPFNAKPQAMTIYARFVEMGTCLTASARVVYIGITGASTTTGRVRLEGTGTKYRMAYTNADNTAVTSTVPTTTPTFGQVVELVGILNADGSVQVIQSVNGGTAETGTASAANRLEMAWGSPLIHFNGNGSSNPGSNGFLNVVVMRGVHGLDAMRRVAKV